MTGEGERIFSNDLDGKLSIEADGPVRLRGASEPPCTLDVQMAQTHELTFYFDKDGHVSKVECSCGREGTVEML